MKTSKFNHLFKISAAIAALALLSVACKGTFGGDEKNEDYIAENGSTYHTYAYSSPILIGNDDETSKRIKVLGTIGYTIFESKYDVPTILSFSVLTKDKGIDKLVIDTDGYANADYEMTSSEAGGFIKSDVTLTLTPTTKLDNYDGVKPLPFKMGIVLGTTTYWANDYIGSKGYSSTTAEGNSAYASYTMHLWKAQTWCQDADGNRVTEIKVAAENENGITNFSLGQNVADFYLSDKVVDLDNYLFIGNQSNSQYKKEKKEFANSEDFDDDYTNNMNYYLTKWWISCYADDSILGIEDNPTGKERSETISFYVPCEYNGKEFTVGNLILTIYQEG